MEPIIFSSVVILFGLIYGGFQIFYNLAYKNKIIDHVVLEENIKTADLYDEIIFLKLGEEGVKDCAISHLVESGYLENNGGVLKSNPQKDLALLTELEKNLMKSTVASEYGEFILKGEITPFQNVLKKYAKKAQELNLFYKRGSWFNRIGIVVNLFFCFLLSTIFLRARI